jgi:hypothetical protein
MEVHRYDLDVDFNALVRETLRAVKGWDWSRGAYGHALSLPADRQLHPHGRYRYENYPCLGILGHCPAFQAVFDALECEKASFRLLRRAPRSAYSWHTDRRKGQGVVRFQIPLVSDDSAFLVTTNYWDVDEIGGARSVPLDEESFAQFARENAGHYRRHRLEPGRLHYFDTSRVHTLVNAGSGERITLSFDLVVNDWVLARFPDIRAEVGDEPVSPPPRPGPLRRGLSPGLTRLYSIRNLARRQLRSHA